MEFRDLMDEIKGVEFDIVRVESYYYFEAVILREKLPKLVEKLRKIFGEPLVPSAKELPANVKEAVGDFGGIRDDQTLYFRKDEGYSFFAMLWPWSDEYHITVKMGRR